MKKVLLLFTLLISFLGVSQKLGHLPFKNYTAKDYKGDTQVNALSIDSRGIIYVANNGGLATFDGKNWSTIEVKGGSLVQSIYIDKNDRIFIGLNSDFGEIITLKNGEQKFISFINKLDKEVNYSQIWGIEELDGNIVFQSYEHLFIYSEDEVRIVSYPEKFNKLYKVYNELLISIGSGSLFKLNSEIDFIPFDLKIGEQSKINYCFEYKDKSFIVSGTEGSFVVDSESHKSVQIDLKNKFGDRTIYSGEQLKNGHYVFSGDFGSIYTNDSFDILEEFSSDRGLLSNVHLDHLMTEDGNLVVATKNGFSVIFVEGELRRITPKDNVIGSVNDIYRINNKTYLVGGEGVYSLDDIHGKVNVINSNKSGAGYRLGEVNGEPIFIMNGGVYELGETSKLKQINKEYAWSIYQYKQDSNYVFLGIEGGLVVYKIENNHWIEKERIKAKSWIESIYEDEDGVVWLGSYRSSGLYRFEPKFNKNILHNSGEFKYYNESEIGTNRNVQVFEYNNKPFFSSDIGVFTFDDKGQFVNQNELFGIDDLCEVQKSKPGINGKLWMFLTNSKTEELKFVVVDKDKNWKEEPFVWLNSNPVFSVNEVSEGEAWIGTPDGLYFFKNRKQKKEIVYNTIFRKLRIGDSIVQLGNYKTDSGFTLKQNIELKFEHSKKSFEFEFGTNVFIPYEQIVYSYFLKGFDESEGAWKSDNKVVYTNLPKGTYTLVVKSKNRAGVEGQEVSFTFTILAPWYQTWWFITLCVIVGMVILWGLYRLRTRALRQRQEELENTVEERTAEVVEQKKEVELQRDEAHRQKKTVEHKNREIMESITYAKRLQEAILPPPRLVKEWLTDSFLYFNPKDIVAGDFYWMDTIDTVVEGRKKTLIFFAAADCTGHGVPGAMVSVVCANAMNRAVKEFKLSDPGQVLDKVTELVIQSFDQSEEDIKDGMDIALCALDIRDKKLYYSGANNPVYIITDADPESKNKYKSLDEKFELIEIKATKQPVGKYDLVQAFETREIDLKPGDAIYVFSDGFADQFGGLKGKKYKYATFKRYLLEISQLEMEAQKSKLINEFETWRDGLEQVDDICVIGVRINGKERKNFTDRELEVLSYLNEGLSSKLIADRMNITKNTVDTYRRRLLAKTNTYNATELINYCKEKDIL